MGDDKDTAPILTHHSLGFEPPKKERPQEEGEDIPLPEHVPDDIPTADPVKIEIEKVTTSQSPSVRSLIEDTPCFGVGWMDEDGICPEEECDLRSLCHLVYKRAHKAPAKKKEEEDDPNDEELKEFREIDAKNKAGKYRGTAKYQRKAYLPRGRLTDTLAKLLWEALGSPPEIPDSKWTYPGPNRTEAQKNKSAREFMRMYGIGTLVSKRVNLHTYFFNGRHLFRFWTRYTNGGWLDLTEDLAREVMHKTSLEVETDVVRATEKPHQFYPSRVFINKRSQIKQIAEVLKSTGVIPEDE